MKFSEIPYERLDFEKFKSDSENEISKLEKAENYETAKSAFIEFDNLYRKFATDASLVNVRYTVNTEDKFYADEKDFFNQVMPEFEGMMSKMNSNLLTNKFRKEFEKEFGDTYLKNAEINVRTFKPEILEDLQEENKLATEYDKLSASAQLDFNGEKLTLSQITPYKESLDLETRKKAWKVQGEFFLENSEKYDEIYDKLVKVRTKIAKKLGHENFVPLGYDRMTRNCYDESDVEKFRSAIKKYIVPVVTKLKKEQAERNDVKFPMTYPDEVIKFKTGNAKPFGTPEQILDHGHKMYRELSPETAEFIDKMMSNEMLDVHSRKGKAGGGYCTMLFDYKSPFIFANFNGTAHDVEVMTHEAGHAFAFYTARNIVPAESGVPTMESAEVHSMSMEFFTWPWAEGFFGEQTQKFYYQHLLGALEFLPYGTLVDHFQHEVYKNPDMTPQERHELWGKLEKEYRPWFEDNETAFYKEKRFWQRQAHIYTTPFYYIDYCFAQTVALQFWSLMQEDREEAWAKYMKFVSKAGTLSFKGLLEYAGMKTPFGDEALKNVSDTVESWIANFDSSKLN